jgi:CheY-like chemotaxis protein
MNTDPNNPSILLIEDNPVDLDLTLRAFAKRKLVNPINVARDGAEALSWIARWETGTAWPALILLDLKLPKVNGLEVLRQFKAHPELRTIPVIILTTSDEDIDMQKAYAIGANSYIVKPVDFDKFMDVAAQVELYWCVLNKLPPKLATT